jgi:hypothetical protein
MNRPYYIGNTSGLQINPCPHPLTPSPNFGRRGTGSLAPLPLFLGEGLRVRACKGDMLPTIYGIYA